MAHKTKEKVKARELSDLSDLSRAVKIIGIHQADLQRTKQELELKISELKERSSQMLERVHQEMMSLAESVFAYALAHRDELTDGGKTKTIELSTGTLTWRIGPHRMIVKNAERVIADFKRANLYHLVRVKEEVNKDLALSSEELRQQAGSIKGVSIVQDEFFSIKPSEVNLQELLLSVPKAKKAKKKSA